MQKSRRYAAGTRAPVDASRREVERVLARYGADGFHYGWERRYIPAGDGGSAKEEGHAVLGFLINRRRIQIDVPMPDDPREQRRMWRVMLLLIKAKLEAVESGIGTLESEFLANIVIHTGQTIGGVLLPRLTEVVESGRLLPSAEKR